MIVMTPAEMLRAEAPSPTPSLALAVSAAAAASQAAEGDSSPAACAPHDRGASIPVAVVAETDIYLSPETARRLACDCGLVEATVDAHGAPLSVGRKTRTIPASIKRALLLRDRTCRFPGCDHRLFLDSPHLRHWADGGETKISNLTLLCSIHHHYVHERGYRILQDEADASVLHFLDPRGKPVVAVPPRPSPPDLGWTSIRAANAHLPLSAETSILVGHSGSLDLKEAVGRVFRAEERAQAASPEANAQPRRPAPSYPWRSKEMPPLPPMSPVQHATEDRRPRDEDSADPDYDFVYAGRRRDDLLEWAMEELLATGIDPMATVPAPYAPPAGWRSKVRD